MIGGPVHDCDAAYRASRWQPESYRTHATVSNDLPILFEHITLTPIPLGSWTKVFSTPAVACWRAGRPFAKNTSGAQAFPPQAIFLSNGLLRKQIPQPVEQTVDLCAFLPVN